MKCTRLGILFNQNLDKNKKKCLFDLEKMQSQMNDKNLQFSGISFD